MSETRFMQTVLFGGYERSAVEKRFERMLTQISDLKNELRETKLLYTELSNGEEAAAAAEKILAEERIKLTQAQVQAEKATKKLKATEEDLAARESEIAELKEKLAAQEEELREKTARLLGYESGSDSAALSQVFVAAQQSATQLIQNAKKEAADLEAKSQKLAENVVTEANNSAKQIIYEAEVQAAETVVNAENRLNQMETADANLRANLLADVESISERLAAMQAAFQSFQESGIATLAQSAEMLDTTKQELTAGGIPVFREPVQIGLRLPAEPVLDPVDHNYDAPAEDPAVKQQQAEELARLQAMAAALSGKKPDTDAGSARTKTPVVEYADPAQRPVVTTEAASAEPAKAADATSALAALAAQAEAIAGKKGSSSSGAAAGGNDLAALAAQAAALKKKK